MLHNFLAHHFSQLFDLFNKLYVFVTPPLRLKRQNAEQIRFAFLILVASCVKPFSFYRINRKYYRV